MATATCADSSHIAVVNSSARAWVSASACTRSFIRELVFGVAGHLHDSTPLVEADLRFFDRPDVSRCDSFHRWRHAERLMPARDVPLHEVYGHRRAVILRCLRECVGSAGKSPHADPHRDRQRRLPMTSWRAKVERFTYAQRGG
jgi:hypothetical protein